MRKFKQIILTAFLFMASTSIVMGDNMPASQNPPGGLNPQVVPQFVSIGFDDNGYSGLAGSGGDGGMTWATDFFKGLTNPIGNGNSATFDGAPVRATFLFTTYYIAQQISESPVYVKRSWRTALEDGHEYGNHTQSHSDGANFSAAQWNDEISSCENWITKPFDANEPVNSPNTSKGIGADPTKIYGFRSPFLHYNDNLFSTLTSRGYQYDCSIEDGWDYDMDGTNYRWPYTMDAGSPGHDYLYSAGIKNFTVGQHPGLWELPVHPVIVPTDAECANYGLSYSLRDKVKQAISWFDLSAGKLTALDYSLFVEAKMTKAEALATLKYTFDLRNNGNRAPFLFGAHTDEYSPKYTYAPNATAQERRETIEEFVTYVLSFNTTRFVPLKDVITWMNNPIALDGDITIKHTISSSVVAHEIVDPGQCSTPAWSPTTTYWGNDLASHNGRVWEAQWWTRDQEPGTNSVWVDNGECGGGTSIEYYGTISPAGNTLVNDSASQTYTMTADNGYEVTSLIVDGNNVTPSNSYTFNNVTSDHTIIAEFNEISGASYTVVSSAGVNGSISPLGTSTVSEGNDITFSITPVAGYEIDVLSIDGSASTVTSSYTFTTVSSNHSIDVTFKEIPVVQYDITASAGANGSISPNGTSTVNEGANLSFTISANSGYEVEDVLVNGSSVGAVTSYDFTNVSANQTIAATFKAVTVAQFDITASAGANGSISPNGTSTVNEGANLTFTISANSGYEVDDVLVNGASVGAVTSYDFTNVTANQTIAATFKAVTVAQFDITASAGANGSISPNGTSTVNEGANLTFTISANSGYEVDDVLVNGASVGAVTSYNFTNVTANQTIAATFKAVSTGGTCDGVAAWDANQNWTEYSAGDQRVNGGKLWECVNVAYSIYEPSGAWGHFGWSLVSDCN